jgi:hypothetical protein
VSAGALSPHRAHPETLNHSKIKTEIDVTHGAKHQRAIGSLHRPRPEKILSVMN